MNAISVISPGILPPGTFGSEAAVEIRFPTNLRLFDRLGQLAHALDDVFHDVELSPQSHLDLKFAETSSRVASERALFLQAVGEPLDEFLLRVRDAWAATTSILEIGEVDRLGVRSGFVVGLETVEAAVERFRHRFFDYYDGYFEGMGKPVEVQVAARFDQWKVWEGIPFSCSVRVTPIHVLPELQDILQEYEHTGGMLMDMDRYAFGPLDQRRAPDLIGFAAAAGIGAAGELSRRLNNGREAGDDASSADSA